MTLDVYGPIILPGDAEDAITNLLKEWFDTYLRKMEILTGRPGRQLPSVRAWGLGDAEERLDELQPPAVMVECARAQMRAAGDFYTAGWETTIAVITKSDKTYKRARELAQLYGTAAGLILINKANGLGEFLWEDQDYGVLTSATRRFLARGEIKGTLTIPQVAQIDAGPATPAPDPEHPPVAGPIVEDIGVTVDLEP